LLVAAGRTPNTEGIGLELAGVELTERGYMEVDERLETTAAGVWAVGDVAGSPHFTHISVDDFRVVLSSLNGGNRVTSGRKVPFCLSTDPEFARVGLSEKEAKARGIAYRLFKIPMGAVLRTTHFRKSEDSSRLWWRRMAIASLALPLSVSRPARSCLPSQIAMIAGLTYTALRDAILAHPTLVEGLNMLFLSTPSVSKSADANN
jgi:pyruvate/2-oxoglutarate dehydrogenase complex dihydrolipoamide dehydrogenase (E3) component